MRIESIEIKSAAVTINRLPFAPLCCDACEEESSEVEIEIISESSHLHMAMGPYCAEKYLRAFA